MDPRKASHPVGKNHESMNEHPNGHYPGRNMERVPFGVAGLVLACGAED